MGYYLIQKRFDEIAKKFSSNIAISFEGKQITYQELIDFANRISISLKNLGVKRGDRVAIVLRKSVEYIMAILGILKADAAYVPIDSGAPKERLSHMLKDSNPKVIICDDPVAQGIESTLKRNSQMCGILSLGVRDKINASVANYESMDAVNQPAKLLEYCNIDTDLAYLLYTSGSTGSPKAVMISHLNVYNYINWAIEYFEIDESQKILNTALYHYDMSVFDIFCTLHTGATLTIVPEKTLLFPTRLIDIIEREKITIWKATSSLFSFIAKSNHLNVEKLSSLRKIIFSGEALPTRYLIEWMKVCQRKDFYNAYGPTECTGISVCYKIDNIPSDASAIIPIGKACNNSEIFAVNENGNMSQMGEPGELFIRGSCVGQGYWNNIEKTAKAFVVNPFNKYFEELVYRTGDLVKQLHDGNYIFIERKDFQVKVGGHRVELGEIEFALKCIPSVVDAAVVAVRNGQNETELAAFLEIDNNGNIDIIKEELRNRIPHHMIPRMITVLECIPRGGNGKVDRKALISSINKVNNS